MTMSWRLGALALACVAACLALPVQAEPRDGAHDFDFAQGSWHTHATKIRDPFDGGTHTVTLDGTKIARPLWGGKAWVEEIEADGPDGHWEGMSLFVYSPAAHQWSQTYIDGSGDIEAPTIGSFKDGRGEFFGTETYQGRNVLVRGVWSGMSTDTHHYEVDLSQDGGRTWVAAFKADLTRLKG